MFDLNATDLRVKVLTRRENELGSSGRGDGGPFRDGVDPTQDAPPPPPRRKKGPGDARRDRAMHHLKKVGKQKGVSSE